VPVLISQVVHQTLQADVPRDWSVNVVHHQNDSAGGLLPIDYQNHADEVRDCFVGNAPNHANANVYARNLVTVKVYDMSDPKPRPERAVSVHNPVPWESAVNPRFVALVCSWYADRNLPRQRGRIFMGPFGQYLISSMGEKPTGIMQNVLETGKALYDVGGANVYHVVYSPTTQQSHAVTDYWVNDVWDEMHSRLQKETTRQTYHP
jgi:hypothetical protein